VSASFVASYQAFVDPELASRVGEEIRLVEEELERQVGSQVRLVQEVGTHTLRAGGKRLRPALVTLSAAATGRNFDPSRTRLLGACMELIHMATLVHDDVIDHAETRRGVRTAASVFGHTASILSGDVLLAKAMAILAADGDLEIIRMVSRAVVDLAEGEVQELVSRGRIDLSKDEHFEILRRKTATLIECCCSIGALAAGANPIEREALAAYGRCVGLAFQIADDLLDYRADREVTGKPWATDFREGCPTLPLIHLMPKLTEEEAAYARMRFGNGVAEEDLRTICRWMEERGVFREIEQEAGEEAERAKSALAALPHSPQKKLLESVADFVVARSA
jgi:octaprenyl-diphosphate synthase